MHRNTLCGVILLAIFSPQLCSSLVCYDNVVAGEPVFIGCNFPGAACGITNQTSVIPFLGFNITDNKMLYYCADRSSSCSSGPFNFCNANTESEQVSCMTSCCDTDKCNLPDDAELKVETVPESKALKCYQLFGNDQKRVKCMFQGAVCLYTETIPIADITSNGEPAERSGSQLCTTREFCAGTKKGCDISNLQYDSKQTCTTKCCTTDYCNPLPSNEYYNGRGPHPNAKAGNPTYTSDGSSGSGALWYVVVGVFSVILSLCAATCRYRYLRGSVNYAPMRNT